MTMAAWLRSIPSLTGTAPGPDADPLPTEPEELFARWIRQAVDAGVPEAHGATLATVDADGIPDARTLILKDLTPDGWAFAGPRTSAKAAQLGAQAAAALNFWWPAVLRAVRVRGRVVEAPAEESAADLAARSPAARDGIAPGEWVLWRLVADRVEFWQGSPDRKHLRTIYRREGPHWRRSGAQDDERTGERAITRSPRSAGWTIGAATSAGSPPPVHETGAASSTRSSRCSTSA
ncbi:MULTISPECIES: pyridoxamine 5'-phosphate oxidase family protein [Microbacterium]|jgi:pyridoxamine 5'-phosphate oxidase|uniref:pyridoxamine 5'-phosphate oxidase family protein n=1 Tax=Microbacterium TaxID=33882 RepID=UPI0027E2AF19|nr:pyridoxamine 5'-phosphate oxidase family protein [Microbacterium testaceum]